MPRSYNPQMSLDNVVGLDSEWTSGLYPTAELVIACLVNSEGRLGSSPSSYAIYTNLQGKPLVGHNLKFDLLHLQFDIKASIYDTMVLSWLVDENMDHSLKGLAKQLLNKDIEKPIKIRNHQAYWRDYKTPLAEAPIDEVKEYCFQDTEISLQLLPLLLDAVGAEGMLEWYWKVEEPLIKATIAAERQGIQVDEVARVSAVKQLSADLSNTKDYLYGLVGYEFNASSHKQVGNVLYTEDWMDKIRGPVGTYKTCEHKKNPEKCCGEYRTKIGWVPITRKGLNLKTKKTTPKGGQSTDEATLRYFAGTPVVDTLLDYRGLFKLLNTYLLSFPAFSQQEADSLTSRLYFNMNMWGTTTGRASHSNPNMANIPVKGEHGKLLRSLFIPKTGYKLIVADYEQIEYRLLAEFSQERVLLDAFFWETDIHATNAALVLDKSVTEVTDLERYLGKTLNYAALYGAGARKVSETLRKEGYDLEKGQAADFLNKYYEVLPSVLAWKEEVLSFAHRYGYIVLPSGRKRRLPDINSYDMGKRSHAERQAINCFPQGTTADVLKLAMVKLNKEGIPALLQVHDELIFEVLEDEAKDISQRIELLMEQPSRQLGIEIPMKVTAKICENWGDK